ncbi:uncharacterized protein LOC126559212 [Anopheles maculipalpis]|uniref:uncharacterized protein LOC126559212 n=1 Tax=Anopheles maculipalpis TaxID=1496333 RepID=UPI0021595336|nr:uncharacterized protein LOC126559212 [Anopheles maculipalpis]
MDVRIVIVFCCTILHLELAECYSLRKADHPTAAIKEFGSIAAASSNAPKSPLLEIVLRILDTIQIIPKKRSRRQERSQTLPLLTPLFGSAIFGGRVEKPLLALSLESGEAATEPGPPSAEQPEDDDDDGDKFYPPDAYQLRRITSSKRFYDMVLGVLHVLESQARQKVQRAREQRESVRSAYDDEDDEEQPA